MNKLYTAVGGENISRQLMERYRLQEKKEKVERIVYGQVTCGIDHYVPDLISRVSSK